MNLKKVSTNIGRKIDYSHADFSRFALLSAKKVKNGGEIRI